MEHRGGSDHDDGASWWLRRAGAGLAPGWSWTRLVPVVQGRQMGQAASGEHGRFRRRRHCPPPGTPKLRTRSAERGAGAGPTVA